MRGFGLLLPLLLLTGCGQHREGANGTTAADTLTRAQHDSILGASKLPGARAVQRAIDVSDSAAARARRLEDTIY